jgi:predicted nucleotidyltransferase
MTRWTESARHIAEEFTRRAAARFGDRMERIVLFGSVARGTDGPESDIDVIVIVRDTSADLRDGLDAIAFDFTLNSGRGPALVLYPGDAYARARTSGSELAQAVEREGVVLWTRSEERSSAPA